jgi:hypothetical protein
MRLGGGNLWRGWSPYELLTSNGSTWRLDKWATGLVVRLLEVTHGQWLYRNVVVHDATSGQVATARKEEIVAQIESERAVGGPGLVEEDRYLLDINMDDLSDMSVEGQEYWLLAIQAARVVGQIAAERITADGTDYG